jgi:hypothetical protein
VLTAVHTTNGIIVMLHHEIFSGVLQREWTSIVMMSSVICFGNVARKVLTLRSLVVLPLLNWQECNKCSNVAKACRLLTGQARASAFDLSEREAWLAGLREELVSKTYRPSPVSLGEAL